MTSEISPERLDEIRRHDGAYATIVAVCGRNSGEVHRHELLAAYDATVAELADVKRELAQAHAALASIRLVVDVLQVAAGNPDLANTAAVTRLLSTAIQRHVDAATPAVAASDAGDGRESPSASPSPENEL